MACPHTQVFVPISPPPMLSTAKPGPGAAELAEARRYGADDRYSSLARLRAIGYFGVPKIRALFEATYFAGLRKAGMPEE